MRHSLRWVAAAAGAIVLSACDTMEPDRRDRPRDPSRPATGVSTPPSRPTTTQPPQPPQPVSPPAGQPQTPVPNKPGVPTTPPAGGQAATAPAAGACPPGSPPIGVLAVVNDTVFRNNRPAANGERVCNGDTITTNASGVGVVLPDNDRESDSIHVAENTDPRFTRTQSGCISVDNYNSGRVIATSRRHCMVLRTRDTLMLLEGGRVQFQVARNTATEVVPLSGTLIKLQPLSEQQVNTLSRAQLMQQAAPPAQQPRPQSLNIYTQFKLVRPALQLPPSEIQRIDRAVLRRSINPALIPR